MNTKPPRSLHGLRCQGTLGLKYSLAASDWPLFGQPRQPRQRVPRPGLRPAQTITNQSITLKPTMGEKLFHSFLLESKPALAEDNYDSVAQ